MRQTTMRGHWTMKVGRGRKMDGIQRHIKSFEYFW